MSYISNAPESANLTQEDRQVFEAGRLAADALAKTFDLWIVIARAVELARIKADQIGRRSAFQRILEQQGLAPSLGNTWPSQMSTATRLLAILARLSEVQAWRETLNKHQRTSWSAPSTIFKHCPVFAAGKAEQADAAALAKVDRMQQKSGIDWAPEDEAALRASLSEAHVENQKLAAEAGELRARIGVMEMVDRAAAEPVGDNPYLAALQSENETLKAKNAALEAGVRMTLEELDKAGNSTVTLNDVVTYMAELEATASNSAKPIPGLSPTARKRLVTRIRALLPALREVRDMLKKAASKELAPADM